MVQREEPDNCVEATCACAEHVENVAHINSGAGPGVQLLATFVGLRRR
jgi:hypothetical protein